MNAYKVLYKDQLTEKPIKIKAKKTGRSKSLGWVFFTNNTWHKPKSVRTYHSLHIATKQYRYFTPNTFYHSESREQSTLRWINAISVDFDVKDNVNNRVTLPELLERINAAGLPLPTQIVKTPSGGFHIHWYLKEARRCDRKNRIINHYKRVLALLIEEIGAVSFTVMPEPIGQVMDVARSKIFDIHFGRNLSDGELAWLSTASFMEVVERYAKNGGDSL
ncbi:hypothetical protein [Cytobacillus kochii]|uniref:hypothetical protein n=1 Tax=Cytobacillus kochii TaxID=859143 RepID=UPI00402A71A8